MTEFTDNYGLRLRGHVDVDLIHRKTGARIPVLSRHNVITYTAADIMAKVLSGDTSYLPQYIGLMYGAEAAPSLDTGLGQRVHTWRTIAEDALSVPANVLIVPLAVPPGTSLQGNSALYTNNGVTFTAYSGAYMEYGFPTAGSGFAPAIEDITPPVYFYHAVLLSRRMDGPTKLYYPFARTTLKKTVYPEKPENYDLAVFWTIKFE